VFRESPPALELRGLTKRYDDGTLALEDFDLEIPAGSFFGLLGPNGAGKTTLISAVCNLIRITAGQALVFGKPAHTLEAGWPSRTSTWTASSRSARRSSTTAATSACPGRKPNAVPRR
jgi:ABC-type cobalamin/Fe3+-siderophores transport system ATPase subunit